jgi:prolyl oligopeptidase
MNIICREGTQLDGQNPTILYGYGGYGIALSPGFDPSLRLWMDQGGVYVIANLRGGGEYGEDWHLAGNLTKKQNVFDDFAACAKWLIDNKYTNASKLCIKGGSNGGLLMGAAVTQHPELFGACVSYVGLYDMLRVELDPNGEFNTTEFGTVKIPDQFKALYAYSPYHNVKENSPYPAVMFITGDHDGRVNPYHSRKMTALLQSSTNSGKPILLRTSARAGHGGGTALNDLIERETDAWSFIVSQLGVEFRYDK